MIKVLYIISTLEKTGPVNVLFDIIQNLDRKQFKPIILTLSTEKSNSIKAKFEALDVNIYSMKFQGILGYLQSFKIKNIIHKIKPDIIHTHCFRSTLFTALYLKEYKTITTIHCDYDNDFVMGYGHIKGLIMAKLFDFPLEKIKKRICCSKQLCEILTNKKRIKLDYINNGIDTESFHPIDNKPELRIKLNLPTDKTIFIWVGAMIDRKNPLLLINAIKEIKNKNLFFIFCGEGYLKQKLENIVLNTNNILLTGNVDNIQEYLQASDFYISTSLSEGLPLSVLEGMACGLPCILSDIEQHKYILQEQTRMLFKSQDSVDLINKLNNIVKVDYNLYSLWARQATLENFSSELMSANYQKKYEELSL